MFPPSATLDPGGACRTARDGDKTSVPVSKEDKSMKLILTVLGVSAAVVGVILLVAGWWMGRR
jgi:hypothetical protein